MSLNKTELSRHSLTKGLMVSIIGLEVLTRVHRALINLKAVLQSLNLILTILNILTESQEASKSYEEFQTVVTNLDRGLITLNYTQNVI